MNKTLPPLRYQSIGQGETIVLIHGYVSDSKYWKPVLPYLTTKYQVVTIDLLGFGRSPKPKRANYSLEEHAAAVYQTLESLGIDQAILVGHSMGSIVSAELARTHPSLVKQLYLLNMPIYTSPSQAMEELASTNRIYRHVLLSKRGRPAWVASKLLARVGPKKLRRTYSAKHTHNSRRGSLQNTIAATDSLSLLQRVTVPTVLIEGLYDRTIYQKNLRNISLPENVELRWVQTGHHSIHSSRFSIAKML